MYDIEPSELPTYAQLTVPCDLNTPLHNYSLTAASFTKQGKSPLEVAVHERNLSMIRFLVEECKANVNGEC